MDSVLLTVAELAELLRLSEWTVYEQLRTGAIPGARKIGRTWRVHRATVLAWISGGDDD